MYVGRPVADDHSRRAGCVGAGVGGNLTNREWIEAGEWNKIAECAAKLVENAKG